MTMISNVERARRYVAKCPPAISGQHGHDATFHVAVVLVRGFALSELEAMDVLRGWNMGCQPPWNEAELRHKVQSAANATDNRPMGFLLGRNECTRQPATASKKKTRQNPRPAPPTPKPRFWPMVLKRVAAKAGAIHAVVPFLMERSTVDVTTLDSAGVLRLLYSPGEKVLIFSDMRSQGQLVWDASQHAVANAVALPAGPDGVWFLAQPVDGAYHTNPRLNGKLSRRSEESVTAWRYVVLESDKAPPDEWLRCLIQMPLRIVSICESGSRSVHALVRLDAASKKDWDEMVQTIKPILVTLGADPGALSAVRLTRLPQATRGKRIQRLLFINPSADGTPIIKLPARGTEGSAL